MAKKSLYVFLTSLLGVLLFLILDRLVVFAYLYFIGAGYISPEFDYLQFILADYFILTLVLMLGAWYGIWLGLNWFSKVYEEKSYGGVTNHLLKCYWPSKKEENVKSNIVVIKEKIESSLGDFESLKRLTPSQKMVPEPIVSSVIKKRAPRKSPSKKTKIVKTQTEETNEG